MQFAQTPRFDQFPLKGFFICLTIHLWEVPEDILPQRTSSGPFWAGTRRPPVLEPRRLQSCSSSKLRSTTRAFPNQLESGEEWASNAETVDSSAIEEEKAKSKNGLVKVIATNGGGKVYLVLGATEERNGRLLWPNSEQKIKSSFSAKSVHMSSGNKSDNLAPVEQVLEVSQRFASNISKTPKPSQQMRTHWTGDEKERRISCDQKLGRFRYIKSSQASKLR